MVTIEFFQALRVSESAALRFEDFKLSCEQPQDSSVTVSRAIKWKKDTNKETTTGHFKNAKFLEGGKKAAPVFPEVYQALRMFYPDFEKRSGFMFLTDQGKLFEYRQLQNAFDKAFELAGLDFTGSHIMRHGGCRLLYNQTGDLSIAQQHLGNSSMETTKVYAKRSKNALDSAVKNRWNGLELVGG